MRTTLFFVFASADDTHAPIELEPNELNLVPNVGDMVEIKNGWGARDTRIVEARHFRFDDVKRAVTLICRPAR